MHHDALRLSLLATFSCAPPEGGGAKGDGAAETGDPQDDGAGTGGSGDGGAGEGDAGGEGTGGGSGVDVPAIMELYDLAQSEDGSWMAVGSMATEPDVYQGVVARSPDGRTWSAAGFDQAAFSWSVARHDGRWFMGADPGLLEPGSIYASADGADWSVVQPPGDGSYFQLASDQGVLVAARNWSGNDGVIVSTDGDTWTEAVTGLFFNYTPDLGYGAGFMLNSYESVISSDDGHGWRTTAFAGSGGLPEADPVFVDWVDDRWVVHSIYDCCYGEVPDGIEHYVSWTDEAGAWTSAEVDAPVGSIVRFAGAYYGLTGRRGVSRSDDLLTWEPVFELDGQWLMALDASDALLIATGDGVAVSTDGVTWERVLRADDVAP